MSYFLSDTYDKPKLVENKLVKKIVTNQNNQKCVEEKIFYKIIDYIKNNCQIMFILLILFFGLHWRYYETQKKKNNMLTYSDSEDSQ
jgi:hypothetical protein